MEIKELKTGAVRIAAAAGVPLVPVVLWGTQRLMTKDHPRTSRAAPRSRSGRAPLLAGPRRRGRDRRAADRTAGLLDDAIRAYPQHEAGAWWVPASYGGTAPTPEEAARLDAEERRERRRRSWGPC